MSNSEESAHREREFLATRHTPAASARGNGVRHGKCCFIIDVGCTASVTALPFHR